VRPRPKEEPRPVGRPRRRRTAADFALPPLPAPEGLATVGCFPTPQQWDTVRAWAGRAVNLEDADDVAGLLPRLGAAYGAHTDPEATAAWHAWGRAAWHALEDAKPRRFCRHVVRLVQGLVAGYPTPEERARRQRRAARRAAQARKGGA